jgi:hypothetical protein
MSPSNAHHHRLLALQRVLGAETVNIRVVAPPATTAGTALPEYDEADVLFTPPDPAPGDDFTAHISNVIPTSTTSTQVL